MYVASRRPFAELVSAIPVLPGVFHGPVYRRRGCPVVPRHAGFGASAARAGDGGHTNWDTSGQARRQKADAKIQNCRQAAANGGRTLRPWSHSRCRQSDRVEENRHHHLRQRILRGAVRRLVIDDLIVARVRAAAGAGIAVRRIAYAKEAFDTYNHPEKRTISDARENFTAIVRQVAANTHCAGYIVVARSVGSYPG